MTHPLLTKELSIGKAIVRHAAKQKSGVSAGFE
jgi:hypothetical protein